MRTIVVAAVFLVLGIAFGFGIMFWVSMAMVDKVRLQEEQRHQELLNITAEHNGIWIDAINEILAAVYAGKLTNRSIPDQVKVIKDILSNPQSEEEPEHLE